MALVYQCIIHLGVYRDDPRLENFHQVISDFKTRLCHNKVSKLCGWIVANKRAPAFPATHKNKNSEERAFKTLEKIKAGSFSTEPRCKEVASLLVQFGENAQACEVILRLPERSPRQAIGSNILSSRPWLPLPPSDILQELKSWIDDKQSIPRFTSELGNGRERDDWNSENSMAVAYMAIRELGLYDKDKRLKDPHFLSPRIKEAGNPTTPLPELPFDDKLQKEFLEFKLWKQNQGNVSLASLASSSSSTTPLATLPHQKSKEMMGVEKSEKMDTWQTNQNPRNRGYRVFFTQEEIQSMMSLKNQSDIGDTVFQWIQRTKKLPVEVRYKVCMFLVNPQKNVCMVAHFNLVYLQRFGNETLKYQQGHLEALLCRRFRTIKKRGDVPENIYYGIIRGLCQELKIPFGPDPGRKQRSGPTTATDRGQRVIEWLEKNRRRPSESKTAPPEEREAVIYIHNIYYQNSYVNTKERARVDELLKKYLPEWRAKKVNYFHEVFGKNTPIASLDGPAREESEEDEEDEEEEERMERGERSEEDDEDGDNESGEDEKNAQQEVCFLFMSTRWIFYSMHSLFYLGYRFACFRHCSSRTNTKFPSPTQRPAQSEKKSPRGYLHKQ